jgi:hypothetical protein
MNGVAPRGFSEIKQVLSRTDPVYRRRQTQAVSETPDDASLLVHPNPI